MQHSGQFSSETGSYGTTLPLTDYIILIAIQPNREHNTHVGIFIHIYHHFICLTLPLPLIRSSKIVSFVFDENFSLVKILDNKLKVVPHGEFILLASS